MDRTDGIGNCSITVHLRQTEQVSGGGVLFEACRVGSVNASDGRMILNWDLGELTRIRPSVSTEEITKELSDLLFCSRNGTEPVSSSGQPAGNENGKMPESNSRQLTGNGNGQSHESGSGQPTANENGKMPESGIVPTAAIGDGQPSGTGSEKEIEILRAVTSDDGTCTFSNLEEGAWLIHASDSSSYGTIEDTLVAVPCYVEQEQTWEGPVYDADVWPKGVIISKADQESETPKSEKEKNKAPQPDIPFQVDRTPVNEIWISETVPGTERAPGTTTLQRTEEPTPERTSPPDSETGHTRKNRKNHPVPKQEQTPSRQITQQRTQPVRTLDDTPLSGLICAFLGCAIMIVMIVSRWRRKGRRNRVRHLAFVAGAGILLASGTVVRAAGEESGSFEQMLNGERKIVLVNQAPDAPCLTVSKEVLDAQGGSRAPEGDVFVFRLSLNGTRASQVRYRVFDRSGEELVDLTGSGGSDLVPVSSTSSDPVRLKTGRDGTFSLRDGQTALFEEVSAGDLWEVTELDQDHYERIVPQSAETLSGTILRNGSAARFVNRYVPEGEPDLTQGTIEITKRILWPEGITLPERGSFRIRVTADGSPVCGEQVVLSDLEDGASLSYGITDGEGCFEIEGNQRAVLHVPIGSDVYVEEIDDADDSFVPSGTVSWKGAVSSVSRISFANRLADFVVAKSLRSGDRQQSFVFCLLGADDRPMEHVPYYLAAENGELETAEPLLTDSEGHFSLRADQRAVFTGLEEGSCFSVREEKRWGYRQVTPSEAGYSRLTVRNGIPVLSFENEKTDTGLFAPSAGGPGIVLILATAIMGMVMLLLWSEMGWKHCMKKNAED